MLKNIIFDWSGVINDNLSTVYQTAMVMFRKYGVKEISLEEFRKEWELPYMVFYNKYIPGLSLEEEKAAYRKAYQSVIPQYPPRAYPGIRETLGKFKEAGINMITVSSDPCENLFSDIKEFGLEGLFSEINCDIHDKAADIKKIVQRNQFNSKETILVGDTTHEIDVGKKVETLTGAVTWGYHTEDRLKTANPDFLIRNLEELESIVLK